MEATVYRYTFSNAIDFEEVEATVMLALYGAQALHGDARTRLDVRYVIDDATGVCVIDASTPAGQDFNQLFTEFARRSIGADAFKIERSPNPASARVAA